MVSPPQALLSVSDKEGLVDFARGLRDLGFELIGTDGTAKILKEAGLPVTTVADYTGLREGLGGRVKTLHPRIFAGILAPTGDEKDLKDLGAVAIDLVTVNLYPFEATVAKPDVTVDEAVENIDIGGVSLIRRRRKTPRGSPWSCVRPATATCSKHGATTKRSQGSCGRNWPSRRLSTRPDTMPRSSTTSPRETVGRSHRRSASRTTRSPTSGTARIRINRLPFTGSRTGSRRRRPRSDSRAGNSRTTT